MNKFSLSTLSELLNLPMKGEDVADLRPALLEDACPGAICLATTAKFAVAALEAGASALLVSEDMDVTASALASPKPRLDFARLLGLYAREPLTKIGVHPTAVIYDGAVVDPSACVGPHVVVQAGAVVSEGTCIGPGCFLECGAKVGPRSRLGPGVVVGADCIVGADCVLKATVVIGGDGFGYEWDGTRHVPVPHVGIVVLEDDVCVGSGSCIDRAKTGETRIGRGVRIDNLVQVGHGVLIGPYSIIVSQAGISGSAVIGRNVVIAGQVGVSDHARVGDRCIIAGQTGVRGELAADGQYMGFPAQPAAEWRRQYACLVRLPSLVQRVRRLEKALGAQGDEE